MNTGISKVAQADNLRELLWEAKKKCTPPLPENTGMSVCRVRFKDYPHMSLANMIKARPDRIPELKECIRLSLIFYAVYYGYINPEGAVDITNPEELDEVANKLEQIQKNMIMADLVHSKPEQVAVAFAYFGM